MIYTADRLFTWQKRIADSHDGEETDLVNIYLERWVRKLHLAINHLSIPELELLQNIHFVESESP